MPPNVENTASLEAGLRSLVRYYLDCMLHSNAIFLCERLVACNPREENVLLLATCYFGESSELRAHALLQGCRLPESRFLLATCCLNLGRLAEVERVLLEGTGVLQKGPNGSREEILAEPCPIPFGAAGLRLLGLACQAAGRRESAEEYFRLSLELDPLMWVSIQSLCELGADFDVEKHFERFLEKAAGAAARSSAGGPVPAVETRGKRLPWSSYLQASSGGRADEDVVCGAAWWRGDDAAQAMPPPPPGARSSAASVSAGTMETPTRSRGGETKHMSPVGGGGLFGTPVPTQRRGASGANATTSHSQAFMTPAFRTPAASGVRFNAAGGGATPGGGIGGGRGRSGRGMSSSAAAVSRGKSCRRKGGGAPRGAAATRPATASSASSSAASDGIGHLLDLGARLGAFFPPAVGPGPVPGLEQLLQEASEAVSSAEEKEKERPAALTTAAAAATPSGDGIGTPIGKAEASGVGRRGGRGRIFATPGLTPIPTAWTPDHAGARDDDDVSVRDNDTAAQEETPSMFLAGLLRGTPETAGGAARRGGGRDGGSAFFSETPVPLVEGRLPEPVGMRAARMSAAEAVVGGGGGGLESSALRGEMASARAREAATSVREEAEAGASEGAGTASASVGVGVSGRVQRSAADGGRRIGGRLSFSSAVGTDDASSTGSVAGGGGGGSGGTRGGASVGEGGTEDRGRVPLRSQGRRRVATPGTTTPSASSHARHAATPAARSSMRPPPPAGGSGATPTSAALAGRVSRLSTSNRGAGGAEAAGSGRASRYAYPSITPMDVDEGAAERTPAAQNSRRPNTRAASKRTGNAAAVGGTRQTPVGTGTVGRVPVGSRWAVGKNNGGGGMNSNVSAGVSGDRGPGGAAADGRKEKEEDAAVKMTREQWQRAQYEETMAFAAVVIRRVSALGGEEREKDKETERVVAALTILKAAAQASEAVRESTVVGAGAGAWAGDWAVARVFPHQEGGKREPGGGAGGGKSVIESGLRAVASLLVVLGKGYQHLMQFRCVEALEELKQLPPAQFCTGWVLHQVGKAYFERADYSNAKSALESMQRYDPHRLEGLDLLSTTLWHLKREVELSYLAQKVSEFDRHSPYTWCVVGNCFSLQKEHETALRFFQRAIQLDADMTYAYTLCGHEYVVNEDFDKAVACFRMAIRTDRRHYNAWYGLGSIYHRQEKYDMAEYHFRRALSINPQSSVLRVYLGMVLHANKRYVEALDMLGEASKTEPTNPQASFQRANVLMSMERYAEALHELEAVRNNVPKESAVYFLMGKVCKKLGKTDAAMRHFTIALDLHNKDKNLIKAAVDRLNEPDLDEEEKF